MNDISATADPGASGPNEALRSSRPSIVLRLSLSISAIAMLAAVSILASIVVADTSSGEARAINVAGSLRMQTYAIGVAVAQARGDATGMANLEHAIDGFTARYTGDALRRVISARSDDSKRGAYREIGEHWTQRFAPLARAAGARGAVDAQLREEIGAMVARIDHLVVLIEQSLESRLQVLRLAQAVLLMVLLLVGGITVYQLRDKVMLPLHDLLHCARTVRRGDFSVRVVPREADELGQLGEAFNYMVQDLSENYASLEMRVRQKTDELARSNRSLELLYGTTRALSEHAATRDTLLGVLRSAERVIGVSGGAILLYPEPGGTPVAIATDLGEDFVGALCSPLCADVPHARIECVDTTKGARLDVMLVPLSDGAVAHGAMALALPSRTQLADWQLQLAEAVGRHIGAALAAKQRNEERHRLALLDERSVIARELHDSLAQALSFLNIQVARLQKMLSPAAPDPAHEVVRELKEGLDDAYRQLRELLTTFRLRIDGRGLAAALDDTVQEFSRRGGLQIELVNRLPGIDLASSQEIHVLQVVREALSNIEHHAQARHVWIALERLAGARIRVRVDDDGVGIERSPPRSHRYGLVIMRDRAQSLDGELSVAPRDGGGTRVQLEFPAHEAVRGMLEGLQGSSA